jgi:DNA-binding CsgD family transcriptional regulator
MFLWKQLLKLIGFRPRPPIGTPHLPPRSDHQNEYLLKSLQDLAYRSGRTQREMASELIAQGLAQRAAEQELLRRWHSLTPRERQVAALICRRYTNRQMADLLGVSPETIKAHVRNTLDKFGLRGKGELIELLSGWTFE